MQREHNKQVSFTQYSPLGIITLASAILSLVLMHSMHEFMYRFMGFFLCFFSLFKWVDIKGFMDGFKEYDLISKFFKPYLFIFPSLEAILGVLYVAMAFTNIANYALLIIMVLNAISVTVALIRGNKVNCACLGSLIKLPLSVVSLFESLLMILMAFLMLKL